MTIIIGGLKSPLLITQGYRGVGVEEQPFVYLTAGRISQFPVAGRAPEVPTAARSAEILTGERLP